LEFVSEVREWSSLLSLHQLRRRDVLVCWSCALHRLRRRQVQGSGRRQHGVRRSPSRHAFGSDWSLDGLNLRFMLCWIVFVLRFIEQLHAVRSRQVLYDIRGNVGLNMLQLPRLCKLAVRQRLGGRLHVQRRLVGPQRRHVRAVRGESTRVKPALPSVSPAPWARTLPPWVHCLHPLACRVGRHLADTARLPQSLPQGQRVLRATAV